MLYSYVRITKYAIRYTRNEAVLYQKTAKKQAKFQKQKKAIVFTILLWKISMSSLRYIWQLHQTIPVAEL